MYKIGGLCLGLIVLASVTSALPPDNFFVQRGSLPTRGYDVETYFDVNDILCFITNFGTVAEDIGLTLDCGKNDGFHYPKGTCMTTVYSAGLMLGGKVNGEIRTAVTAFEETEYRPGQIIDGAPQSDNDSLRVFKIDANSSPGDPDYDDWPANLGASLDENGNPLLLGHQTLWTVFNDAREHNADWYGGGTDPLGIEVQLLAWGHNFAGPFSTTMYLQYKLYNKGDNYIDSFYIAFWSDPDLGTMSDDFVGCDTADDIFYCYNATNYDIYYPILPAWGGKAVYGPVIPSPGDTAYFAGNPLPDYKNIGMTAFNKFVVGTDPDTPEQLYGYLQGYDAVAQCPTCPYIDPSTGDTTTFPLAGDPVAGTGWLDTNPGDRRMMACYGPLTFNPGDSQQVVFKLGIGHRTNRLTSITELKEYLNYTIDIPEYNVWYVSVDGSDIDGNGSEFSPFATIQHAIDVAEDRDTIYVGPGTYTENINFSNKILKLASLDGPGTTMIQPADPNNHTIIVNASNIASRFIGFTVTGGGPVHTMIVNNYAYGIITDNIFHSNIPIGKANTEVISVEYAKIDARRNLFYENGGSGCIGLRANAIFSEIINNTFDSNERGFFSYVYGGTVINNIVTNSLGCGINADTTYLDYNNVWNNNPDYDNPDVAGSNSISEDPEYVNALNHDYHLGDESPCVNAGDPNSSYNDPDGTRNDMGAYAYEAALPVALDINYGPYADNNIVYTATPEIFWSYYDTASTEQTQFELQVGTDYDCSTAEMWATGPISSTDTSIIYNGLPLESDSTYYVRLRVDGGSGWGGWRFSWFEVDIVNALHVPGDYPSIQEAIDAAVSGDSVIVSPGTYYENITIEEKTIKLIGLEGRNETMLRPADPSFSTIIMYGDDERASEIRGFTITGGGPVHTVQIGGAAPKIWYNTFCDNIPFGTPNVEVISIIYSWAIITRNVFYNNGGIGCVGLRSGAYNSRIINNTFDSNERGFFSITSGGYAMNNVVTNSIGQGIGYYSSNNWDVLDYNNVWNNNPDYDAPGMKGPNSLSENPLYVNAGNHDYNLLYGSPCIDAGDPDEQYKDPDGTRNDIGTFSYHYNYPLAESLIYAPESEDHVIYTYGSTPKIYWDYTDTAATSQFQFEIEVGIDTDWSEAEMWATGPITSPDTFITYAGLPLEEKVPYYLRIRVSDGIRWGDWNHDWFMLDFIETINVPADFGIIQDAINAAEEYDSIVVLPGVYIENIDITGKSLKVIGKKTYSNAVLIPVDPDVATVTINQGERSGTEFSGFEITSGGPTFTFIVQNNAEVLIRGNIFHDNIPVGTHNKEVISVKYVTAHIVGNIFYNNGGIGCVGLRDGAQNSWIINNTFDNNERGFFSIASGAYAINNIVTNSIERGIGSYIPENWTLLDYNDVWNNNPDYDIGGVAGANSISVDPIYIGPEAYNYSLVYGSPCIDAGHPDEEYNDPDGTRNDMGALFLDQSLSQNIWLEPDPVLALYKYMYGDPMIAKIYIPENAVEFSINDVDISSILVNNTIIPESTELLFSDTVGDFLRINLSIVDFIDSYPLLWDTTVHPYVISGNLIGGEAFEEYGTVTMIGHLSGDANADGIINILDITYILSYIYKGGAEPWPFILVGDCDGNGAINILDVTRLVAYLYKDGPAPVHPQ